MANIKIDRIHIRLKGIPPHLGRASIEGMSNEILRQLAGQRFSFKGKSGERISRLDSGTLQASRDTTPTDLQKMIGVRIIESIISKTKTETGMKG